MGEVYKARDTRLDRIVAIKILPEVLAADPEFRDRFDREARVISQLDHPHICALYDVGEVPNPQSQVPNPVPIRFLVMQYLEGETLADRLAPGCGGVGRTKRFSPSTSGSPPRVFLRGGVARWGCSRTGPATANFATLSYPFFSIRSKNSAVAAAAFRQWLHNNESCTSSGSTSSSTRTPFSISRRFRSTV